MSLKSRRARWMAAGAVAVACALPAQAMAVQSSTLNYQCKFPLIGSKPLKLDLDLDVPAPTQLGRGTGEVGMTAKMTVGGDAGFALGIINGLLWLKGVNTPDPTKGMTAFAHVQRPDGSTIPVNAPLLLDPVRVPQPLVADVVFDGTGSIPSLTVEELGTYQVVFDRLQLNLAGTDENDQPVEGLMTPSRDLSLPTPLTFADTDRPAGMPPEEDPTFNVPCKLLPSVQPMTIGQFEGVPECPECWGEAPSAPGPRLDYIASDFTSNSINLRWTASVDDGAALDHYTIRYDGPNGRVSVSVPAGQLEKRLTGLAPDTGYVFEVTAYDKGGNASEPFTANELRTLPPPANVAPTVPGTPTGSSTPTSVALTWAPSSDPDGTVIGYNVYRGSSTTPTRVSTNALSVTGLATDTPYSFTVEAIDNDNATSERSAIGTVRTLAQDPDTVPASQLHHQCKFPLIGTKPLGLDINLDLPDMVRQGEETREYDVTAKLTIGSSTALGIIDGLRWLRGVNTPDPTKGLTVFAHVSSPSGAAFDVSVPLTLDPYAVIAPVPADVELDLRGRFPLGMLEGLGAHRVVFDRLQLNLSGTDADGFPTAGLTTPTKGFDGESFADTDRPAGMPAAEDPTFNAPCKLDPVAGQGRQLSTFEVVHDGTEPDTAAPSAPGPSPDWVISDFTATSINLRWTASTDIRGVHRYEISYDGVDGLETVSVPGDATSKLITGLGADSSYVFMITAFDAAGNASDPYIADELWTLTGETPNASPTAPGTPTGSSTERSINLTWAASADPDGTVVGYDVYQGSNPIPTRATTNSLAVTGLSPETPYAFRVEAIDDKGAKSGQSAVGTVSTKALVQPLPKFNYALAGSTTIKTLTKGTLPLKGSIAAAFTLATGRFEADLGLADTSGRLTALGWLPVTAKIGFVPSGKTTGALSNDTNVLTTSSLVRIKVKAVKLFGAIPLAGGNTCQTKSLSKIDLASTGAFDPLTGGTLTGTYAISDLNGCGALNGLVSPLTAGGGNAISLKLTYQP